MRKENVRARVIASKVLGGSCRACRTNSEHFLLSERPHKDIFGINIRPKAERGLLQSIWMPLVVLHSQRAAKEVGRQVRAGGRDWLHGKQSEQTVDSLKRRGAGLEAREHC